MIQRIQSVFLLLVVLLMGATLICPLAELSDDKFKYVFFSQGIGNLTGLEYPTSGVLVMVALSTISALINIFLFKKRKVQMLVGYSTMLFILLFYLSVFLYFNYYTTENTLTFLSFDYGAILPIIALIFNLLAILRIKKDDNLVKSLNRIR